MGPKHGYHSGGEDEHDGEWDYAGDADVTTWHTWKDHSLPDKTSEFEYHDSTEENIHKKGRWPEVGYQENPEKE